MIGIKGEAGKLFDGFGGVGRRSEFGVRCCLYDVETNCLGALAAGSIGTVPQ